MKTINRGFLVALFCFVSALLFSQIYWIETAWYHGGPEFLHLRGFALTALALASSAMCTCALFFAGSLIMRRLSG